MAEKPRFSLGEVMVITAAAAVTLGITRVMDFPVLQQATCAGAAVALFGLMILLRPI